MRYWFKLVVFGSFFFDQAQAMCDRLIEEYEYSHKIPRNLLKAISFVESGRKIGSGIVAWPWTINANGKPYVFATKAEAVAMIRRLQSVGIKSIDVGCMQINLKHHPYAFPNLSDALDPQKNIAYAASFFKQKKMRSGNWHTAISHYHSVTPGFGNSYRKRVMKTWSKIQSGDIQLANIRNSVFETDNQDFTTHIVPAVGEKIPVIVRFAPYSGMRKGTGSQAPGKIIHVQSRRKMAHRGIFPIPMKSSEGEESIIQASYKLSRLSIDRLPSDARGKFLPSR